MLSPNTIIAATPDANARPLCLMLDDDALTLFYSELETAENVYGPESGAAHATVQRHLGAGVSHFYLCYSVARCVAIAEDETLFRNVRAFAAALAIGAPLPGSHGLSDKPNDGGTKARLVRPRPRKPSGGNAVNPLHATASAAP